MPVRGALHDKGRKIMGTERSEWPADYEERVYAGVLGKIIGVYLGRPFEGWTYEQIMEKLGEINYYVHEQLKKPLVVTDDDISGTFTFLRALEDHGYDAHLTAADIGRTWLNYILEGKTILWWGGMGKSTEHTAYQRLKKGVEAPRSGSVELNGQVVAEQIGAQIFIDGWGMVAPGDPKHAADLARKAGSVSHDGEAIHGAVAIAAMEAEAFVESDMNKLFDVALRYIPAKSVIHRVICDVREWSAADGDWKKTFARIQKAYGYDTYGGGCHMVPNHAVIVLALCNAPDDFQRSLMIANTAGWDTDCNSGNVGCLMGIKNGLASLDEGPDWRTPVADRIYLPTADGGRCISDAVREALEICKAGYALRGESFEPPKKGARFHFEMPGALQGFRFSMEPDAAGLGTVWNAEGHSKSGRRSLGIGYCGLAPGRVARVATGTFIPEESSKMRVYDLIASPTLYPGQQLEARVVSDAGNDVPVRVGLMMKVYGDEDRVETIRGPDGVMAAKDKALLEWMIPETQGRPICEVGLEIRSEQKARGTVFLDYLTWSGAPKVTFGKLEGQRMWQRAWVEGVDKVVYPNETHPYLIMQQEGVGVLMQGTREWSNYRASSRVKIHMAEAGGIAVCVQGLKRYYGLLLGRDDKVRIVKEKYGREVLSSADFQWSFDDEVELALETNGSTLAGFVNGKKLLEANDPERSFSSGAVALLVEEGRLDAGPVRVEPLK